MQLSSRLFLFAFVLLASLSTHETNHALQLTLRRSTVSSRVHETTPSVTAACTFRCRDAISMLVAFVSTAALVLVLAANSAARGPVAVFFSPLLAALFPTAVCILSLCSPLCSALLSLLSGPVPSTLLRPSAREWPPISSSSSAAPNSSCCRSQEWRWRGRRRAMEATEWPGTNDWHGERHGRREDSTAASHSFCLARSLARLCACRAWTGSALGVDFEEAGTVRADGPIW